MRPMATVLVRICALARLRESKHTDTDNAEDDHDTRLPGSPVLLALDELVDDLVAGDERLDGGHCVESGDC